ncbi:MAG: hypothetical protein R2766_09370 [Saprospiraceae bacterium]
MSQTFHCFLEEHRETVPEKQQGLIMTSLKVDGDVTMGIISLM